MIAFVHSACGVAMEDAGNGSVLARLLPTDDNLVAAAAPPEGQLVLVVPAAVRPAAIELAGQVVELVEPVQVFRSPAIW